MRESKSERAGENMINVRGCILTICVLGLCAGAVGCGSGSSSSSTGGSTSSGEKQSVADALPPGTVASVQGRSVTEAVLDHWIAIQAATDYESVPKGPIPRGVVPDPPEYSACIAHLRASGTGGGSHSNAELKSECEAGYATLRAHVLGILISFKWWEAEAQTLGISVSQSEIAKEFARYRRETYGSIADYERYQRRTGQTLADEYLRMRMDLYTIGLREHFRKKGPAALASYFSGFSKQWSVKTTCAPADVVPNCKEYKGSLEPEARI